MNNETIDIFGNEYNKVVNDNSNYIVLSTTLSYDKSSPFRKTIQEAKSKTNNLDGYNPIDITIFLDVENTLLGSYLTYVPSERMNNLYFILINPLNPYGVLGEITNVRFNHNGKSYNSLRERKNYNEYKNAFSNDIEELNNNYEYISIPKITQDRHIVYDYPSYKIGDDPILGLVNSDYRMNKKDSISYPSRFEEYSGKVLNLTYEPNPKDIILDLVNDSFEADDVSNTIHATELRMIYNLCLVGYKHTYLEDRKRLLNTIEANQSDSLISDVTIQLGMEKFH